MRITAFPPSQASGVKTFKHNPYHTASFGKKEGRNRLPYVILDNKTQMPLNPKTPLVYPESGVQTVKGFSCLGRNITAQNAKIGEYNNLEWLTILGNLSIGKYSRIKRFTAHKNAVIGNNVTVELNAVCGQKLKAGKNFEAYHAVDAPVVTIGDGARIDFLAVRESASIGKGANIRTINLLPKGILVLRFDSLPTNMGERTELVFVLERNKNTKVKIYTPVSATEAMSAFELVALKIKGETLSLQEIDKRIEFIKESGFSRFFRRLLRR